MERVAQTSAPSSSVHKALWRMRFASKSRTAETWQYCFYTQIVQHSERVRNTM